MDPALANDPFISTYYDVMTKAGLDPKKSTYFTGWIYAWYMVAILKEAASYRGGLNRANIALAAHAIQVPSPALLPGVTSKLDGLKDAVSRRVWPDDPVQGQRPEATRHVRTRRATDQPRRPAGHLQDRHQRQLTASRRPPVGMSRAQKKVLEEAVKHDRRKTQVTALQVLAQILALRPPDPAAVLLGALGVNTSEVRHRMDPVTPDG